MKGFAMPLELTSVATNQTVSEVDEGRNVTTDRQHDHDIPQEKDASPSEAIVSTLLCFLTAFLLH